VRMVVSIGVRMGAGRRPPPGVGAGEARAESSPWCEAVHSRVAASRGSSGPACGCDGEGALVCLRHAALDCSTVAWTIIITPLGSANSPKITPPFPTNAPNDSPLCPLKSPKHAQTLGSSPISTVDIAVVFSLDNATRDRHVLSHVDICVSPLSPGCLADSPNLGMFLGF